MELPEIPPALYLLVTLAGAAVVLRWRYQETSRTVTVRSLVAPPLGMSTGFFMFLAPQPRVPLAWAATAVAFGAVVFSWPLAKSSSLLREGDRLVMKRSPMFLALLLGLVAVRLLLRGWLEQYVTQLQAGALFFLVAWGAIVRWRVGLWLEYRRLVAGA